jgi:hypothetical protein
LLVAFEHIAQRRRRLAKLIRTKLT